MGLFDKAKQAAEQAATKAREGVEDVQTKRELGQAYNELGKAAFDLIERGELAHEQLESAATRVRAALAKTGPDGAADGATTSDPG